MKPFVHPLIKSPRVGYQTEDGILVCGHRVYQEGGPKQAAGVAKSVDELPFILSRMDELEKRHGL